MIVCLYLVFKVRGAIMGITAMMQIDTDIAVMMQNIIVMMETSSAGLMFSILLCCISSIDDGAAYHRF